MDFIFGSIVIGTGATLVMDLWMLARRRLFGLAMPDYGLVGRWLAYLPRGRFTHHPIGASPPIPGERAIGWVAHYTTGITFAGLLLGICGVEWARYPTMGPALAVGLATVAAPFLVMQPGMGAGIAASRTPRPGAARAQSIITHGVFGLGLYAAGLAIASI